MQAIFGTQNSYCYGISAQSCRTVPLSKLAVVICNHASAIFTADVDKAIERNGALLLPLK